MVKFYDFFKLQRKICFILKRIIKFLFFIDFFKFYRKWEILVCDWCGFIGFYVGCQNIIKVGLDDYMCLDCYEIEKKCKGIY